MYIHNSVQHVHGATGYVSQDNLFIPEEISLILRRHQVTRFFIRKIDLHLLLYFFVINKWVKLGKYLGTKNYMTIKVL